MSVIYRVSTFVVIGGFGLASMFLPPNLSFASALVPTPSITTVVATLPILWSDAMYFVIIAWGALILYWIYLIIIGLIGGG